ncbi:hypothetical protein [Aestuariivirga sp.]|jgi:hypothetical protein|uniref:hypothetical protein n=1 Tax=Aestuariivirga sp. TaxID=2650926 RepID=UPI0037852B1D
MSPAQIVQLLITFAGIALAIIVFLFGPFELLGNSILALVIFVVAGIAAGFAYARLSGNRTS